MNSFDSMPSRRRERHWHTCPRCGAVLSVRVWRCHLCGWVGARQWLDDYVVGRRRDELGAAVVLILMGVLAVLVMLL